ncbi:hypothetical protein LTR53_017510, partial [Teratosphaeriaceae sp. CCFEE 6253]
FPPWGPDQAPPPQPRFTQFESLDRTYLLRHLAQLNTVGPPVLSDAQIYNVCVNVVEEQIVKYLGQSVREVLAAVAPLLANAVVYAKISANSTAIAYKLRDSDMSTPVTATVPTPLLGQFLVQLNGFVQARNEGGLTGWIALEPPFNQQYGNMIRELQGSYPKGSEEALEQRCTQVLKAAVAGDEGSSWTSFVKFTAQYLAYLRDVSADVDRYLETYALLSELQQRANSALSHSTLGHLLLPIVVANAKLVCRLAIGLDKQPELIAHLRRSGGGGGSSGGDEGAARETLPERAANILRQAFVTCLNDRVSGLSADGKPEGKKRGIYTIANLCLKILFQCRKTRNATQIFENIYNLSPPLSAYPKRERVTYLYYLGRFLFQNNHFYRAQLALQHAHDEAPARSECVRQRRHILVYLIASNIILGRFPSQGLLSRPEAQGLAERFIPICLAIRQGNLALFRRHLDLDGEHAEWFLHFRILLQLRNRCEVLVWRSLVRKVFLLAGYKPASADPSVNKAATLNINHLVTAFSKLEEPAAADDYTDPDFADVDYGDADSAVDVTAMESKLTSLIDQGLLSGFIAHRQQKFAVTGAKAKGGNAVAAGFPAVWGVLKQKAERSGTDVVPGWKTQQESWQKVGPGMVLNFGSMRAVGANG